MDKTKTVQSIKVLYFDGLGIKGLKFLFRFRACLSLPPQNHMLLEHKLQRNFLPLHTTYINGNVAASKKVALTNGNHKPLTNGSSAHVDDAAHASLLQI